MNFSTQANLFWQQFPSLLPLMKALTLLGNEEFFLLLLPLLHLCIDRRAGLRLGALVILGDALNILLKVALARPRPYWIDARVQQWATDNTFGLPSSHAQNAAAVWCWVAAQIKKPWAWIAAAILITGIAVSRVFLGVHFSGDVIFGVLLGLIFLGVFWRIEPTASAWWRRQSLASQIGVATVSALILIVLFMACKAVGEWLNPISQRANYPLEASSARAIVARAGAWWGLLVGAAGAARYARFEVDGPVALRAARFVVAMIGVAIIWGGLGRIFPREPQMTELVLRFMRYALLTLWVTLGAPWLFLKFGWLHQIEAKESLKVPQSS